MSFEIIITAVSIVVFVTFSVRYGGLLPKPYAQRNCEGKGWLREFPDASKTDIREFLHTFVDAFAFHESEKLKLCPSDRVQDIYKGVCPNVWTADSLEIETFVDDLKLNYGFDLAVIWHDKITLGEIFAQLNNESTKPTRS